MLNYMISLRHFYNFKNLNLYYNTIYLNNVRLDYKRIIMII